MLLSLEPVPPAAKRGSVGNGGRRPVFPLDGAAAAGAAKGGAQNGEGEEEEAGEAGEEVGAAVADVEVGEDEATITMQKSKKEK